MKLGIAATLAALLMCSVVVVLGEGIYSIARWDRSDLSVTYKTVRLIGDSLHGTEGAAIPAQARTAGRSEFAKIIPALKQAGAGLGNTDYRDLGTYTVNVRLENGCRSQRPDIRKVMSLIRSNTFEPFDPPLLFIDEDAVTDEIREFMEAYGQPPFSYRTNAATERVTLPLVEADRKVLVAGDSVAAGVSVDDADTIASQLQRADATRQYVNLGISGARTLDVVCALERAAERYRARIDELIYVYCVNDYDPSREYGTPEGAVEWLASFVAAEGIRKVTIVYAPFIYDVAPGFTRFKGYRGEREEPRYDVARKLSGAAEAAGFRFIDIYDLAQEEVARRGTQFAALSLFGDEAHLSPYGTSRLVEELRSD